MRWFLAVVLSALAAANAAAAPEPFGQETVETRPFRNPAAKAKPRSHRHDHSHGRTDAHSGRAPAHRHGHTHHTPHRHEHRAGEPHAGHRHPQAHPHDHGIETENMFGFTLGSDTEHAGAKGAALETVLRFGKRDGSYAAVGKKLEFSYGITEDVSASLGLFGSYHRIASVSGFDDVRSGGFNGLGGELRWRLVRRDATNIGVTLHLEPSWQLRDELTGLRGTKLGAENKLIFDTELVKDRVFAAFNVLYEFERVRENGAPDWERSSKVGVAAAASFAIAPKVFVGIETRYLRAYEGLLPETFLGDAWYVGPTLFAHFAPNAWVSLAWTMQVAGHEVGALGRLDLTNFERHQARIKIGVEF